MQECVIYARVSTKEQQEEGYSIPAQLKSIQAYCEREGLSPVAEFVETESAGKAGRTQFGFMLAFLIEHPEVKVVVAHKLDRLYRNFPDQFRLEEDLGVHARYVLNEFPEGPQGELVRDVQLSVAKFYLGNLREEVKKGMQEKAEQGGYNGRAPLGYLNDRASRSLTPDPVQAPLVRHAFKRYASGVVSLEDLVEELCDLGLRHVRSGRKVYKSSLHLLLQNPVYCGLIRYKGQLYAGQHEPLISVDLFQRAQEASQRNRNGNRHAKHLFALRDFLTCGECGCKITAERQRGHVYYRCTKGKEREVCKQRSYTREELLVEQMEAVLGTIEIGPDIVAALVEESRLLDAQEGKQHATERQGLEEVVRQAEGKAAKLLDGYLEGLVEAGAYRKKAKELEQERLTFEHRLEALATPVSERTARVEALAKTAASARIRFRGVDVQEQREVLATVLSNANLRNREITDYQLKSPFDVLEMDDKGALRTPRWALQDLNLWPLPRQGSALPLS